MHFARRNIGLCDASSAGSINFANAEVEDLYAVVFRDEIDCQVSSRDERCLSHVPRRVRALLEPHNRLLSVAL